MTDTSTANPGHEATDLVARLAELSGHVRFYAIGLERKSREIAEFAVELAEQIDKGQQPAPEQLERADALSDILTDGSEMAYDFSEAERLGSRIWMIVKVLQGDFALDREGQYSSIEDIKAGNV